MNGVRNVPSMYRRAGRNFGLSPAKLLARVVFPAALPQIIVGLRIALGIAWLVVVAAEMIAVDSGLGYLVIDSRNSGKALRPGGRRHDADRPDRIGPGHRVSPAGKSQVRSLGVPE